MAVSSCSLFGKSMNYKAGFKLVGLVVGMLVVFAVLLVVANFIDTHLHKLVPYLLALLALALFFCVAWIGGDIYPGR
jgi:hypothetical protein